MYQVFDSELFGIPASPPLPPLPPVDDDYALQRYRDPGDDIDDVLGFLGLGLPPHAAGGSQMDGTADDDPAVGGGWGGCPGDGTAAAAAAGRRGAFGGQLMDSDDYDYVDYSCFSSGVTSPNLDSEFFARAIPTSSMLGGGPLATAGGGAAKLDVASSAAYHPWEFAPISSSSSCATTGLRSHSPYFHLESSSSEFRLLSDRAFAIDRFVDGGRGGLRGEEFDSEAEARVREIARYLASFEVESWPNADGQMTTEVTAAVTGGGASSFSVATSLLGTNSNHLRSSAVTAKSGLSDGGRVFHPGYDDACCGLESTMVNPNEVFPDRIDRSDHQYASRPCHRPQPAARTDRHTPRTNNNNNNPGDKATKAGGGGGGGGGVSVLEALLRSNEPIDPNKGSGAAIRLDSASEQSSTAAALRCCGGGAVDHSAAGHKTAAAAATDGVLKKLLTARAKDSDSSPDGLRRRSEVSGGGGGSEEEHHGRLSFATPPPPPAAVVSGSAESGFCGRVGQNFGFAETQQKQSTTIDAEQNGWGSMSQ